MRQKLTYANVTATLALFIAVGGASAFAATKLPDRSVGEFQLRPGAVTAEKIRKNAVTAPKIKAEAIKQGKIAGGAITAAKIAQGAIESAAIAPAAITNEKIANGAVSGEKVATATLGQVPSASRADFATAAESANPAAFARITKEATVDQNLSKGIAAAKEGTLAGIYCVNAAGFNPRGAQVTPQFAVSGQISAYVTVGGTADCPAPGVEVQTFDSGARAKEAFYVTLYR